MAVEGPDSYYVVRLPSSKRTRSLAENYGTRTRFTIELQNKMTKPAYQVDVPSVGVAWPDHGAIPVAGALVEDVKVVAVEMHRVAVESGVSHGMRTTRAEDSSEVYLRGRRVVFHNNSDGLVLIVVHDVPFFGVVIFSLVGEQQHRLVVMRPH